MSDLCGTGCGCEPRDNCGCGGNNGCQSIIWIILLLVLCGGNDCGGGCGGCGGGCGGGFGGGFGGGDSCLWIIILLFCCGGNGFC